MPEWTELPRSLLEPPDGVFQCYCDNCDKHMPVGSQLFIYASYPEFKMFCSHECACDWIVSVLEEDTVE